MFLLRYSKESYFHHKNDSPPNLKLMSFPRVYPFRISTEIISSGLFPQYSASLKISTLMVADISLMNKLLLCFETSVKFGLSLIKKILWQRYINIYRIFSSDLVYPLDEIASKHQVFNASCNSDSVMIYRGLLFISLLVIVGASMLHIFKVRFYNLQCDTCGEDF